MRSGRAFGMLLGVGAIAGATAVIANVFVKSAAAATLGSPRERPLSVPPPSPSVSPVPVQPSPPITESLPEALRLSAKTKTWMLPVIPFAANAGVPLLFALAWIQKESGGNPCAYGSAKARGPDGHPREQGIGQLYNPDDMKRFGVPSGSFRTYCKAGTQIQTRELTFPEIIAQAKVLVQLITHARNGADEALRKNGFVWSNQDYWKMVKLVHGLPGLVKSGSSRVTSALGRPPRDWWEFKGAILGGIKLDPATEKYRQLFERLFKNAEETAASVSPDAPGMTS